MTGDADVRAPATSLLESEPGRFGVRGDDAERAAQSWCGRVVLPPHPPAHVDLQRLGTVDPVDPVDDNGRSVSAARAWSDVLRREALAPADDAATARCASSPRWCLPTDGIGPLELDRARWKGHRTGVMVPHDGWRPMTEAFRVRVR
ncbi:hypothetical protein [Cellulomonas sp.]|uniref:hypothetical protein n=1 Tax=Cellulomonas sp. TaxID=40001 RepID=UPI0028119C9F|nr:hypothetical protein [Cellulomonas sp.]